MANLFTSKPTFRGGGGGNYQKTENVVIVLDKIVTGKGANWETDYLEGRLFYSALGQNAEYSAEGNPITAVKLFQGKPKDSEGKDAARPRPSFYDRKFKTPMVPALEAGAVVLLENCTFDKDKGGFVGGWMKVLTPKALDVSTQFPAHGYIMVRPERVSRESNKAFQTATMVKGDYSVEFKGRDAFRVAAIEMIQQDIESPSMPGNPGVIVRAVDVANKQALIAEIYAAWDVDLGRNLTAEEAVDQFLKVEDDKLNDPDENVQANSFTEAMKDDYFFELVPAALLFTGSQTLPSVRHADKTPDKDGNRAGAPADLDDSISHFTYTVDMKDNEGNTRQSPRAGFVMSHVFAVRKHGSNVPEWDGQVDESAEAYTRWSRTYTRPTGESRDIRGRTEFPSATLPAEVEAVFAKNAKENGISAGKFRSARREAKKAEAAPVAAAEQEVASPSGP